ncbi:CLUMA_CG002578, isoform A [Clunio marinus]|uniref:TRAF3-interacting protein 1 n=1 Tax=Clunio marinus TaxID=568069 RepID=A0A1J1HR13_9DIPT|nr:CLUMA_CG002578, isoform A [Clunio marinus]
MTENNLDPEIWKKTQDSLGKFVKKPPLTEKLLKKPPFKFIHDVVKVVIRDTNFLTELFTESELNVDNIKDRDGKMKFLQKLIDVVKIVTKKELQVKASKIVAGLEPEKTNELFQAIGYALENNLDSKAAIEAIKHGYQNGNESKSKQKTSKGETKEKTPTSKATKNQLPSRDKTPAKPETKKSITTQRSVDKKTSSKDKEKKERSTSKSRPSEVKDSKKVKKLPSNEKINGEVLTNGGSIESQHSSIHSLQPNSIERKEEIEDIQETTAIQQNFLQVSEEVNKEHGELKINGDVHHEPEIAVKDTPPPPESITKPQDELAAIIDEEAEFRRKEKLNKKFSAKHRQKSVEEVQPPPSTEPSDASNRPNQSERTERFQSSYKRESVDRPRTSLRPPSARPASSRPAAPRRRDKNVKQKEHLKDLLQKLVRSVNPMGKLMDFVQEDIDSMQREYTKWDEIYKQATIDLKREQTETASAIEPLKYQLGQLEKLIKEHHETIDQLAVFSAKHRQKSVEEVQPPPSTEPSDASNRPNQSERTERFQSSYKRESVDRPRTSLRPPSARPASSRPAAPRRRDKNIEIVLQPDETVKIGDISVKMEEFTKELEDDGENLVIIEDSTAITENFMNERLTQNSNEEIKEDEQGKLVQQILETEKNFEGALGMEGKKTEIEFDETKTQTNVKQIEHLKDLLQKLVRSVNPMGKLMDFVQEDIDSMQREYTKWDEIYKQATIDLKKEQTETASAIEPLKYQLGQLEKLIKEHHETIDQLRGNLLLNEQKIVKLFTEL